MQYQKSIGAIVFYIFIIIFIVLAYLNNNGTFVSFFTKKPLTLKKNMVQIEYKDREYLADYTKKFSGYANEIANFEDGEKWKGEYRIDGSNYWEGKGSFVVLSKNHAPTTLSLRKSIDLTDKTVVKILVYSVDQQNVDNIKKVSLRLGNTSDTAYYEYDIRSIKQGWSIIDMPKANFSYVGGTASSKEGESVDTSSEKTDVGSDRLWGAIEKVSLVLDSRPSTQVELSYDRLWAEKNADYKKEFLAVNFDMLSPRIWNGKSYTNVWAMGSTLGLINKVTGVRNFTYTAKVIPQKIGSFGINARTELDTAFGYYLDFGGVGTGSWRLYKMGKMANESPVTDLDSGGIANFQIEANQPLWLRLSLSGNSVAAYLSTDGKNFTKLTEKNDGEHSSGGIGIHTANAALLLESVEFKQ